MGLNSFNTFTLSEEDKKKGQMYMEQKKRKKLSDSSVDITEYLRELKMIVEIDSPSSFTIPRISQLTQKTNQFNMTTRRYTEEDIKRFTEDKDYLVFSMKVKDKFGDNGIVGVGIVKKNNGYWNIDTFLLSCRVIGRKIENVMLSYIIEKAYEQNIKTLVGLYVPTVKNIPAKTFYKDQGFKPHRKKWIYHVDKQPVYPDFITVVSD